MRAPARLGLFALVLAVVFAVAFVTAGAVVPESRVQSWAEETTDEHSAGRETDAAGHDDQVEKASSLGLGLAQDGYRLSGLSAPGGAQDVGELSLTVTGPDGVPVTEFDVDHDKELHLIVVRADGEYFRHVHPEMNADGGWSLPWEWDAPGTYRVFADFVPSGADTGITLSSLVQVAGNYTPVTRDEQVTATTVDGFGISLNGDLTVGELSELKLVVTRDGDAVADLEPYLGAFGHLVALRQGDLAYLHVHPRAEEPQAEGTFGPEIAFEASAPTPGRYLLFLDFKVDGQVRTAALVLDATGEQGSSGNVDSSDEDANTNEEEGGS